MCDFTSCTANSVFGKAELGITRGPFSLTQSRRTKEWDFSLFPTWKPWERLGHTHPRFRLESEIGDPVGCTRLQPREPPILASLSLARVNEIEEKSQTPVADAIACSMRHFFFRSSQVSKTHEAGWPYTVGCFYLSGYPIALRSHLPCA